MIKFFIRLVAFSFIFILMLYVSVEAGKYTRDRARLSNIETLSKSIQFYNITYGYYPQSGLDNNVSVRDGKYGRVEAVINDIMRG